MSFIVTQLCRPLKLPPTQKAVLMALADYCHDDGKDWHSLASLMEWTCLGKTTVIDALKALETALLIKIERRFGAKSTTFVQLPALAEAVIQQVEHRADSAALQALELARSIENQCATRTGAPPVPVRLAESTGAAPVRTGAPPVRTGAAPAPEALEASEATEMHQGSAQPSLVGIDALPADAGSLKVSDQTLSTKKAKKTAKEPAATDAVWKAYAGAYEKRYGVLPLRNGKVNTQLASLIKRLPKDEAPAVADYYVWAENPFYLKKMHGVGPLLADAEQLRTQWASGHRAPEGGLQEPIHRLEQRYRMQQFAPAACARPLTDAEIRRLVTAGVIQAPASAGGTSRGGQPGAASAGRAVRSFEGINYSEGVGADGSII